jgi:hypothetical protein
MQINIVQNKSRYKIDTIVGGQNLYHAPTRPATVLYIYLSFPTHIFLFYPKSIAIHYILVLGANTLLGL